MVAPAVFLVILALFALEGLVILVDAIHSARAEAAYWDARANRPELYDWAKELDL